jgi:catechol 2,3-dioxygenase-like lactoylglutathione lyase family enzyme
MFPEIVDATHETPEAAEFVRSFFTAKPNMLPSEAAEEASTGCHNTGIHHIGLHTLNAAAAEFYRDVLGMEIAGGSSPDHPFGATAPLNSRANEESGEIALSANPASAHIAFKVCARVVERNIPIKFAANHCASFAFYFDDPDGNMIEVCWPARDLGRRQPTMELLNLSQPDGALLKKTSVRLENGLY